MALSPGTRLGVYEITSAIGASAFVTGLLLLWVTLHFGILPGTLVVIFGTGVSSLPLTSDFSAWYASRGLFVVALALVLAIWSFRNALAGRKVLSDRFLDA